MVNEWARLVAYQVLAVQWLSTMDRTRARSMPAPLDLPCLCSSSSAAIEWLWIYVIVYICEVPHTPRVTEQHHCQRSAGTVLRLQKVLHFRRLRRAVLTDEFQCSL